MERKTGTTLCELEKQEIRMILTRQGMQPLSEELEKWIAEHEGFVGTSTLQSVARSFKGKRAKVASEGIKDIKDPYTRDIKKKKEKKAFDLLQDLYKPLLLTMGFDAEIVTAVLNTAHDLNWIVDHCLHASLEVELSGKPTDCDYLEKNCETIGLALRSTDDANDMNRKKS